MVRRVVSNPEDFKDLVDGFGSFKPNQSVPIDGTISIQNFACFIDIGGNSSWAKLPQMSVGPSGPPRRHGAASVQREV